MRSQSFLNKYHSFIRTPAHDFRGPTLLKVRGTCSRNTRLRPFVPSRTVIRTQSTSSTPPLEPDAISTTQTLDSVLEGNETVASPASPMEETGKIPIKIRRIRTSASNLKDSSASSRDTNPLEFCEGLDKKILFVPTESHLESPHSSLPPLDIYEDALDKLLITLHPQNQARSMLPLSGSGRPIEPTLGLYCPIEGGDDIIDSTVHELAFYTGSEVLVLDTVQLAAGEWGIFGKAANALNLTPNPLHFSSVDPIPSTEPSRRRPMTDYGQDEGDGPAILAAPSRMSMTIPRALSTLAGRMVMPPSSRKPSGPSRLDLFFEALVNMSCPDDLARSTTGLAQSRPRLIYIRDFPTLAPSSSSWYPALLNAVRQRRRGLMPRSSTIPYSPVTIIFGMSPSIANPVNENFPGSNNSLISLLMTRTLMPSHSSQASKTDITNDFSESDNAQAAREKRLRARLRKWDINPAALQAEFPRLRTRVDDREQHRVPGIILVGGPNGSYSMDPAEMSINASAGHPENEDGAQFFRSTVLVPRSRSLLAEHHTRMSRRRLINELTMRMGIGAIGGVVESSPAFPEDEDVPLPSDAPKSPMWEEWGNKLESWSNVRKTSDRAIGSVIVQQYGLKYEEKPFVVSTLVPWTAVQSAWLACNQMGIARARWLKETFGDKLDTQGEEKTLHAPGSTSDQLVSNIKNDPDLDPYEARLLPCIVDANSLTTTFSHVHLPSRTIDAVRTIVSLPLLHPYAFQQGILKEHGMTGCLLFGPPGTGKTLVVRALAKEAGCRMLMVSPSDVMDMYVGEGEKLVRAVFSLARQLSPCVVFLDEIDALFGARMSARESGSAFAHRGVITEFMQEMDGLKSSKKHNVVVIGATNRPFDLDDAVLRRLPRRLLIDLPGEKEREEILKILLRDETLATDVNTTDLAKKTEGFSGSDLKHLCVSAALDSVKEKMVLPWASRHPQSTTPSQGLPTAIIEQKTKGRVDDAVSAVPLQNKEADGANSLFNIPLVVSEPVPPSRTLSPQHFTQALKEITPSSSETLGSLSDLRKWNEEFGEGRRNRTRQQVWGKGRFGFIDGRDPIIEDGRVEK